jgi:hypothetical protein
LAIYIWEGTVQPKKHRVVGQESTIQGLLDNENFQVFNNLATGAPLWAGTRQFAACFARPDRTITDCLHTLLPIEVKPTSVIAEGTELVEEIQSTLEMLYDVVKAKDHRWIKLSSTDWQRREEIVRSSPASKAFTQAYGKTKIHIAMRETSNIDLCVIVLVILRGVDILRLLVCQQNPIRHRLLPA